VSEPDADLTLLFRDESAERLDQMDAALLAIESGEAGAEAVDSLFRHAHTIKGAAGMLGFADIRMLAHAAEDVLASARDAGAFPPALAAPLLHATAALRALVNGAGEPVDQLLTELAASRTALLGGDVRSRASSASGTSATDARSPPEPSPPEPSPPEGRALRVPAAKIDHLLAVAGEIMQYRNRLAHSLGDPARQSPEVADALGAGQRLLDDLKDTAVGMRTLPLALIAGRLPRLVRDLAQAAGKEVDFHITGTDTELDRVILESLSEPLGHLLRNAVVHGIESPAERERAGKPARGQLELRAVPRGRLVEIVVADDGRGISPGAIEEARHEGSLADVLARPGYSTAAELTDLAGRGVGLDAVRSYVRSLGGSLEIHTEPGQGTQVVQLLPLALALMDVLLFERAGAMYGVPLSAVEQVLVVTETLALGGRPVVEIRGRTLPVADFAELIGAGAAPLPDSPPGILISAGGGREIVTCDALMGEEQIMIKSLGPLLAGLGSYLGAAILGDGRIALLVDPAALPGASRHRPGVTVADAAGARADGPVAAGDRPAAPKVLVVEDSFTVRALQRSILEAAGYPVVTARDGREALAVLDHDAEISLVITDLEMPELDGVGLTRAIRAGTACSSLPVVIVTSHGSEDDRLRGIAAGADAYMLKQSFDQQALLATVERLVGG
jgi:two-component system, chemotaxis family, sensor kinase CheA